MNDRDTATGGTDDVASVDSAGGGLGGASGERVRRVWRELTGAAAGFRGAGWVVAAAPGDERRILVVRLQDAGVVSAPAELVPAVREVVGGAPADLTDPEALVDLVRAVVPVAGVRGPAVLAYADAGCFKPHAAAVVATVGAGDAGVVGLAAASRGDDAEESSITGMTSAVSVIRAGGRVVAAAGYEVWGGEVAQVGVLTDPRYRGRGLGTAVASAAVARAVAAGLVAQWRARAAIVGSRRIARRLGFVDAGWQLAARLGR
jgi:GNAT superfamily N-acetyltransferase